MRTLVASTFLTLDGVMQAPGGPEEDPSSGFNLGGWSTEYWDDQMQEVMSEATIRKPFDLLLGRGTYDIFAAHWPYITHDPVAPAFNAATKYVASTTLAEPTWANTRVLSGDVVAAVRRLKEGTGPELQVHGSWALLQSLLGAALVDEFRLWIFPVVVGAGKRLFGSGAIPSGLELVDFCRVEHWCPHCDIPDQGRGRHRILRAGRAYEGRTPPPCLAGLSRGSPRETGLETVAVIARRSLFPDGSTARPASASSFERRGMRVNQWQVDTDRPGRDGDVPVIEDELIVRATAGDVRARTCLLAAVRPLALRYGRACLRRRDEALCSPEDIAQEVCIAIMGALPTYRPERGSFHGLVRTIAQHKAVDAYRAAHRDRCSPTADPPDTHVDVEGPEHRVLSAERQEYFGHLLATLPAWQRQVIELRVVVGLSAEETAQMVGGTAGAVRVTQHRVLKYLRRRLEADAARPEVSPAGRACRAS